MHRIVAVVVKQKLEKFGFAGVRSVYVLSYVRDGVIVEQLVGDAEGLALVTGERRGVRASALRVVCGFAAKP